MSTIADVDAKMTEARTALEAGNYETALTLAISAQGMLAVIPDAQKGDQQFGFSRRGDSIDLFIQNIRRRQAASQGIQRTKVTYARVSSSEE